MPCEACCGGIAPRLSRVRPGWPLDAQLPRQGPSFRGTGQLKRRPSGNPARARHVSRSPGKGSPGPESPPDHGGWPRMRNQKTPWGDVAAANGGDALPPRPGEVRHFPIRLTGPPPPSDPLSNAGQGQHWEWKRSSLEPSQPGHWDFDAAEAEIGRIFAKTCQKLRALWAVPCIVNAGYPRAVRTRMAPLCLEGPGAGSSNELLAPGREPLERSES
jgi:hypothetical protein